MIKKLIKNKKPIPLNSFNHFQSRIYKLYEDEIIQDMNIMIKIFPKDYQYIIVCPHSDDLMGCLQYVKLLCTNDYDVKTCLIYPDAAFGVWDSYANEYAFKKFGINKKELLVMRGIDINNTMRMIPIKELIRIEEYHLLCSAAGINNVDSMYNFNFDTRIKNVVYSDSISEDGNIYKYFNAHESEFDSFNNEEIDMILNFIFFISANKKTVWFIHNPISASHPQHLITANTFIDCIKSYNIDSRLYLFNSTPIEAENLNVSRENIVGAMHYFTEETLLENLIDINKTSMSQNHRHGNDHFYGLQYEKMARIYAKNILPDTNRKYFYAEYIECIGV